MSFCSAKDKLSILSTHNLSGPTVSGNHNY